MIRERIKKKKRIKERKKNQNYALKSKLSSTYMKIDKQIKDIPFLLNIKNLIKEKKRRNFVTVGNILKSTYKVNNLIKQRIFITLYSCLLRHLQLYFCCFRSSSRCFCNPFSVEKNVKNNFVFNLHVFCCCRCFLHFI